MAGVERIEGRALLILRDNVNTDQIIPSREMKRVSKKGLADGLFANLRYLDAAEGGRTPDPEFVLNQPEAKGANILISGANFGCGSSREHAVWALKDWGFQAVLAESFGSIFRDNCVANGVVPVALDRAPLDVLAGAARIVVDLKAMEVRADGLISPFSLSDRHADMLRGGLSPVDLTLKHLDDIQAFRAADRDRRPWLYRAQEAS